MAYHRKCHQCGTPFHISAFLRCWHSFDLNKSLPEPTHVQEGGFSAKVWDGYEGLYYGNVIVFSCPYCPEFLQDDQCGCGGSIVKSKTTKLGPAFGDLYECSDCGRKYEQNGSEFDLLGN